METFRAEKKGRRKKNDDQVSGSFIVPADALVAGPGAVHNNIPDSALFVSQLAVSPDWFPAGREKEAVSLTGDTDL